MIPKELFQKVRRIEIVTSRLVTDVFAGQYHSVFKGRGIEFDEVREYRIGDDVRTIDWNVTARTGRPHVKKYVEEREMTVLILVDLSSSCRFGSAHMLKSQVATEVAATLAFSAIRNNDKVGLVLFTDRIEKFIPPRKGLQHVLRLIREALYYQPQGRATDIAGALEYLSRVMTRKTIAFLISDFLDHPLPAGKNQSPDGLKKALTIANKRHDLIAVTLNDPRERDLPDCGIVLLEDAETGGRVRVDSSDRDLRAQYQRLNSERLKKRERLFHTIGMDHVDIDTSASYVDALVKFFLKRRRQRALS